MMQALSIPFTLSRPSLRLLLGPLAALAYTSTTDAAERCPAVVARAGTRPRVRGSFKRRRVDRMVRERTWPSVGPCNPTAFLPCRSDISRIHGHPRPSRDWHRVAAFAGTTYCGPSGGSLCTSSQRRHVRRGTRRGSVEAALGQVPGTP